MQISNGTTYHDETPASVIGWLETSRQRGQRIRVFYGDTDTGRDWMEENDTMGMVGRSMGPCKIPLLVKTRRSLGGGGILDNCIVRITTKDRNGKITDVYQHPNYHTNRLKVLARNDDKGNTFAAYRGGLIYASFKTEAKARRWLAFIKGERNSK